METLVMVPLMLTLLTRSWRGAQVKTSTVTRPVTSTRLTLAILHSSVLGVQVLYKIVSKQLIYLLSPCHVVTLLQVYLLLITDGEEFLHLFRYLSSNFLTLHSSSS